MTPEKALKAAIKIIGGPAAVAREIGAVTRQAVTQWKQCPAGHVLELEKAVQRAKDRLKVAPTKHDLRPDLYPTKAI
jgi:DNA-binding transcriptional regulator YdaS (Cro superfamily)